MERIVDVINVTFDFIYPTEEGDSELSTAAKALALALLFLSVGMFLILRDCL